MHGKEQDPAQRKREHPDESDRTFFGRFALVVVGLHAVVGGFVLVAFALGRGEGDPAWERAQVDLRTAPKAMVVTSAAELQEISARETSRADAGTRVAAADASPEQVLQQFCASCHATGVLDAPISHDGQEWQQRMAQAGGIDGLVESAIRGKNLMPPRGGAPQLSDEQIRAAVELMRRPEDRG